MPLLNQRWALHDIDDVEALLSKAVSRSRYAVGLRRDERDDLVTYLLEYAWKLSEKFDPERGSFATFLFACRGRAIADFHRSRYRTVWKFRDSTYIRPRPELVPLDDARLDEAVAEGAGDFADGSDIGLAGVLDAGDRQRARDVELLGCRPPR